MLDLQRATSRPSSRDHPAQSGGGLSSQNHVRPSADYVIVDYEQKRAGADGRVEDGTNERSSAEVALEPRPHGRTA